LWRWSRPAALLVTTAFLIPDLAFLGANLVKIAQGGWVPLLLGALVFLVFQTWKAGRQTLAERRHAGLLPLDIFLRDPALSSVPRVPGTAVFLTGDATGVPVALLHNLKHNHVLHERVALLTLVTDQVPHVGSERRLEIQNLGSGFHRLVGRFGFMEDPNVPELLKLAEAHGFKTALAETTFFLGRETLVPTLHSRLSFWRKALFSFLSRNAQSATAFFRLPPNRVVELGEQIEF
jgi:KUP system potassium uptake protein